MQGSLSVVPCAPFKSKDVYGTTGMCECFEKPSLFLDPTCVGERGSMPWEPVCIIAGYGSSVISYASPGYRPVRPWASITRSAITSPSRMSWMRALTG